MSNREKKKAVTHGCDRAVAATICAELASGKSLRTVCDSPSMPSRKAVFSWLRDNPEFVVMYEKAQEESADALFEELLNIADDGTNDWMAVNDKDNPGYRLNGEHVQRSRLRIDARKWIIAKKNPKKYSDKLEHVGAGGGPIQFVVVDPDARAFLQTRLGAP